MNWFYDGGDRVNRPRPAGYRPFHLRVWRCTALFNWSINVICKWDGGRWVVGGVGRGKKTLVRLERALIDDWPPPSRRALTFLRTSGNVARCALRLRMGRWVGSMLLTNTILTPLPPYPHLWRHYIATPVGDVTHCSCLWFDYYQLSHSIRLISSFDLITMIEYWIRLGLASIIFGFGLDYH